MIDQLMLNLLSNNKPSTSHEEDVAGVIGAVRSHTLVRKANIITGNMDWESSKGITAEDSEWQIIPSQDPSHRRSFTTVKNHGVFQLNVSSSVVDIDIPNKKMTLPWGINRGGDSLINLFDVGPGQGWQYTWNSSVEDSTHTIIQDGDTLTIYTTGNELKQTDFVIKVLAPAVDQANVFPLNVKRYDTNTPPVAYWTQPYYVTYNEPGMDTIGNLAYATRVDTLIKYLAHNFCIDFGRDFHW